MNSYDIYKLIDEYCKMIGWSRQLKKNILLLILKTGMEYGIYVPKNIMSLVIQIKEIK